ncbi:hypothetical protein AFB00_17530 [Pseudonocardia sp. HH130630-07]|nr:hypothetical protein AFB00_17530 [Pseudonocardia sp. HH130630-07]
MHGIDVTLTLFAALSYRTGKRFVAALDAILADRVGCAWNRLEIRTSLVRAPFGVREHPHRQENVV